MLIRARSRTAPRCLARGCPPSANTWACLFAAHRVSIVVHDKCSHLSLSSISQVPILLTVAKKNSGRQNTSRRSLLGICCPESSPTPYYEISRAAFPSAAHATHVYPADSAALSGKGYCLTCSRADLFWWLRIHPLDRTGICVETSHIRWDARRGLAIFLRPCCMVEYVAARTAPT